MAFLFGIFATNHQHEARESKNYASILSRYSPGLFPGIGAETFRRARDGNSFHVVLNHRVVRVHPRALGRRALRGFLACQLSQTNAVN